MRARLRLSNHTLRGCVIGRIRNHDLTRVLPDALNSREILPPPHATRHPLVVPSAALRGTSIPLHRYAPSQSHSAACSIAGIANSASVPLLRRPSDVQVELNRCAVAAQAHVFGQTECVRCSGRSHDDRRGDASS